MRTSGAPLKLMNWLVRYERGAGRDGGDEPTSSLPSLGHLSRTSGFSCDGIFARPKCNQASVV